MTTGASGEGVVARRAAWGSGGMATPSPRVAGVTFSEADLQSAILDLAQLRGWRCLHVRPGRTTAGWRTPIQGDAGWPDLTLCRPPRLLALELKSTRGRVEPAQ